MALHDMQYCSTYSINCLALKMEYFSDYAFTKFVAAIE